MLLRGNIGPVEWALQGTRSTFSKRDSNHRLLGRGPGRLPLGDFRLETGHYMHKR